MIVVTGSKGFIGQHLIEKLSSNVITFDIDNKDDLLNMSNDEYKDITHIYHLGAISDTICTDIDKIYQHNIKYTLDLFDKCIEHGISISYASSASVYGNGDIGRINPLNYYAMSKATIDLYVQDNLDKFKNIHGYRFFNVYGEYENHKGNQASPIYTFIKQAKETGVIKVFDFPGDGIRDFIHVNDVIRIMLSEKRSSGIYDVGTGTSISFSKVANIIANKFNATIETIPFPKHLENKYQFHTRSDISYYGCMSVSEYVSQYP